MQAEHGLNIVSTSKADPALPVRPDLFSIDFAMNIYLKVTQEVLLQ